MRDHAGAATSKISETAVGAGAAATESAKKLGSSALRRASSVKKRLGNRGARDDAIEDAVDRDDAD